MNAPKAAKHPITRSFHGRDFVDDYEWLRDKESPEVISYLEAENAYTESKTAAWSGLVDDIYAEIKSRIKETDMSVPQRQGDWWYYGRTIAVSYTHLTLPTILRSCRSRWSPYH